MFDINHLHRQFTGVSTNYYELSLSNEYSKSQTESTKLKMQDIIKVIEKHLNPFRNYVKEIKLQNILSQQIMNDNIRRNQLQVRRFDN